MPKKILKCFTIHDHLYQANKKCVYINYADAKGEPVNHKGQVLSDETLEEYIKHLQAFIIPLNSALKSFVIRNVDTINMAPHPFFTIEHKQQMAIDKNLLEKEINAALEQLNKPKIKHFVTFSDLPRKQPVPEKHNYNLRSR